MSSQVLPQHTVGSGWLGRPNQSGEGEGWGEEPPRDQSQIAQGSLRALGRRTISFQWITTRPEPEIDVARVAPIGRSPAHQSRRDG